LKQLSPLKKIHVTQIITLVMITATGLFGCTTGAKDSVHADANSVTSAATAPT
jgi:hypothetical protein